MNNQGIKEKSFSVRCTKEEKDTLNEQARQLNLSLSDYVIQTCLNQNSDLSLSESRQLFNFLCSMQSSLNKFKARLMSRKDYIRCFEKEMKKLCQR